MTDDQVRGLLDALLTRLRATGWYPRRPPPPCRSPRSLCAGAVLHAQRLLNVEGYPVLRVDADGVDPDPG